LGKLPVEKQCVTSGIQLILLPRLSDFVGILVIWTVVMLQRLRHMQLNITNEQVKGIVMQYLTAHPEKRDLAAAGEGLIALQAAFPCR
jgi:hypothetical protein